MNTSRVELLHFNPTNLRNPAKNTPIITPIKTRCKLIIPSPKLTSNKKITNRSSADLIVKLAASLKSKTRSSGEFSNSNSNSKAMVVVGVITVGIAALLMDESSKALALGPEGPLVEEFWDNMRRYGLYALTVSTGAIWALLEPIYELLKNPISAILIIVILGGGFFMVSQVITAMVGLSDFSYEYGN